MLVESKRAEATRETVNDVLALNGGHFVERIELWDWRVLESLAESVVHDLGNGGRKWFMGATIWDEEAGGSTFVWSRAWNVG